MYISKEISKLRDFDNTEKYQQQVMRTIQSEADRHEEQYTLDNLKTVLAKNKIQVDPNVLKRAMMYETFTLE